MRVFYEDGIVYNVDDECPSVQRFLSRNAEEIPIEIFGDKASYATKENTTKVNGVWQFNFVEPEIDPLQKASTELYMEYNVTRDRILFALFIEKTTGDASLSNSLRDTIQQVSNEYGLSYNDVVLNMV